MSSLRTSFRIFSIAGSATSRLKEDDLEVVEHVVDLGLVHGPCEDPSAEQRIIGRMVPEPHRLGRGGAVGRAGPTMARDPRWTASGDSALIAAHVAARPAPRVIEFKRWESPSIRASSSVIWPSSSLRASSIFPIRSAELARLRTRHLGDDPEPRPMRTFRPVDGPPSGRSPRRRGLKMALALTPRGPRGFGPGPSVVTRRTR